MVYYRKYRPQTIEELDSQEIRESLYTVLSSKEVSHAFLFTGPKGLGKTSTARIVAKAVNCEKILKLKTQNSKPQLKSQISNLQAPNSKIEPCNKCDQCVSITNGTNLDVLEIDGASNRGIDEIRDLRDKIKLSPLSAFKKVYIIDEVHMLTIEAFNALLKMLEEPPNHAMFIFCTTEPHKVPETIISRCVHIQFKKATNDDLKRSLLRIIKRENLKVEDDVLSYIAFFADGSFRDGAKILEELVLLSQGDQITKELIEKKYQISNIQSQISNIIEFLVKKDTKGAIELVSKLVATGIDMKYFIEQIINELHEELLVKVGVVQDQKSNPPRQLAGGGQNSKLTIEEIKELIELLVKAQGEFKYAVLPQLPLELAIIEYLQAQSNVDQSPVILVSEAHPGSDRDSGQVHSTVSSGRTARMTLPEKSYEKTPRTATSDIWSSLIDKVKHRNHSIAGVLRGCSLRNYDNKELVIEAKYKFHKEKLEEAKTIQFLEQVLQEISGNKVKVVVELKK